MHLYPFLGRQDRSVPESRQDVTVA
jgi:hypothetical protein